MCTAALVQSPWARIALTLAAAASSAPATAEPGRGAVAIPLGVADAPSAGTPGAPSRARFAGLSLRPPIGFRGTGSFPLRWEAGVWKSDGRIDGALAPGRDGERACGVTPGARLEGRVFIERSAPSARGHVLAGTVHATVDGEVSFTTRFALNVDA